VFSVAVSFTISSGVHENSTVFFARYHLLASFLHVIAGFKRRILPLEIQRGFGEANDGPGECCSSGRAKISKLGRKHVRSAACSNLYGLSQMR
jgi:hypothetical protein